VLGDLATAVLVAVVTTAAASCTGGDSTVDRDDYVNENEAIFNQLPSFPGARLSSESSSPYRDGENGPVVGYVTRFVLALPPETTADAVGTFYRRGLLPEWLPVEELDGPVLNFRRGKASVSINLESWQAHVLEVGIDHDS
jgi:hypothetical protein